jgi:hypothetical protein
MNNIFNTPFELGTRMVFLLLEISPQAVSLDRLCYLDYALIYSADLGGPESLHTPVPLRGGEYLSRQQVIEDGLHFMSGRGFINIDANKEGIFYKAGENASAFVGLIGGDYANKLKERSKWVAKFLLEKTYDEMKETFDKGGLSWGAQLLCGNKEGIFE